MQQAVTVPAAPRTVAMGNRQRLRYWIVVYSVAVGLAGAGIPSPLYGVYRHQLGFSVAAQTIVFAIYAVVLVPSLLSSAAILRKVPQAALLATGLALACGADLVFLGAHSLGALIAARAVQGAGIGALNASANVLVVETHPRGDHRRAALASTLAAAAGLGIGAAVSGALAQYSSAPMTLVYQIHLGLLVIALLLTWALRAAGSIPPTAAPAQTTTGLNTEANWGFRACCSAVFVAWAVGALYLAVGPSYALSLLHTDNLALAGSVTFLVFAAAFVAEAVSSRLTAHSCVRAGLALLIAGLAATALAFPTHSLVVLVIAAAACGAGLGLTFLGSLAVVNTHVAPHQRAQRTATYFVFLFAGNVIPVVAAGALANSIGLAHAIYAFAVVIGLGAALTFRSFRN